MICVVLKGHITGSSSRTQNILFRSIIQSDIVFMLGMFCFGGEGYFALTKDVPSTSLSVSGGSGLSSQDEEISRL